jgi:hypothetical protein
MWADDVVVTARSDLNTDVDVGDSVVGDLVVIRVRVEVDALVELVRDTVDSVVGDYVVIGLQEPDGSGCIGYFRALERVTDHGTVVRLDQGHANTLASVAEVGGTVVQDRTEVTASEDEAGLLVVPRHVVERNTVVDPVIITEQAIAADTVEVN